MRIFHYQPHRDADTGAGGGASETDDETQTTEQSSETDEFDRERAMATIRKLREHEREARELRKKVAEYEQAESARKAAEMSESEKQAAALKAAQEQAQAAEAKAAAAAERANEALMRSAVMLAAQGFNDPLDAWRFVERESLAVAEDGTVSGVEKAVKALAEAKPYLLKSEKSSLGTPSPRPKPAGNKPEPKPGDTKPLVRL
ncbi:MAG TPA: hypothetical protein PKD55_09690 [Bellilinea sp.]|nr:hypothetical protein [Bellilinea sp.]